VAATTAAARGARAPATAPRPRAGRRRLPPIPRRHSGSATDRGGRSRAVAISAEEDPGARHTRRRDPRGDGIPDRRRGVPWRRALSESPGHGLGRAGVVVIQEYQAA